MNSQKKFNNAIIGKALIFSFALCLTGSVALFTNTAHAQVLSANVDAQDSASSYSADDLDNILAPIALYPDPLLAQVLVAATFNDQIQDASQSLSAGNVAIDDQPWDDSVKAVAHYPKVLFTMAAQPDWTSGIGQAYAAQSADAMDSIQRLRSMALAQGNLFSTQQQQVAIVGGAIQILPARVGYFFLPSYDSDRVFSTPASISFGPASAIDASSDDHIDWHEHHIFDRHHHYARTGDGDRGRRGRIQRTQGPSLKRFNPGRDTERVNRSRYNPGRPSQPGNPTYPESTNQAVNRGQMNHGQFNQGVNRAQMNPGQYNQAVNGAQINRAQYNHAVNSTQINRGQYNQAVNSHQMNRGSFNTAMNRGFAPARPSGRSARR